jgi:hypothetical protein
LVPIMIGPKYIWEGCTTNSTSLEEQGIVTIYDLPIDLSLTEIQERQRKAVQGNKLVVEDGLAEALQAIIYPTAILTSRRYD